MEQTENKTWGAANPVPDADEPTKKDAKPVAVNMDDEIWTRAVLAKFLGYSEETLRGYERSHPERVPPHIGSLKRRMYLKSAVLKWLAENTKQAAVPKRKAPTENATDNDLASPKRIPKTGRPRNVPA